MNQCRTGAREGGPIFFPAPSASDPSSRSSSLPFRPLSWCLEASGTAVGAKNHYSKQRVESRLIWRFDGAGCERREPGPAQMWRAGHREVPSWRERQGAVCTVVTPGGCTWDVLREHREVTSRRQCIRRCCSQDPTFTHSTPLIIAFCNRCIPHVDEGTLSTHCTDTEGPQRYRLNIYIAMASCLLLGPAIMILTLGRGEGLPGTETSFFQRLCLCPQTGSSPSTGWTWGVSWADIHLMVEKHFLPVHRIYTHHLSNAFC